MMNKTHNRFTHAGFTLVELMITLTIVALLLTLGVPSFRDFVMNNRLTTSTNEFVGALNLARSEAIKRSEWVTICSSNDQATCTASSWDSGWIIKVTSNDELLRVFSALPGSVTLTDTGALTSFQYAPSGFIEGGGANTFNFCDDRAGETGRQIQITGTGRPTNITPYPVCA